MHPAAVALLENTLKTFKYRHRYAVDLRGIEDKEHKRVVQGALNKVEYPLSRIRRRTGRRFPITVSDLSRFNIDPTQAHPHVLSEAGEEGHVLTAPVIALRQLGAEVGDLPDGVRFTGDHEHDHDIEARFAPLGLYWLPTPAYPIGRLELHSGIFSNPALAEEVTLAELAHAVDYGLPLSDEQKRAIRDRLEHIHTGHEHPGWFEELGERNYWAWAGERWMGLFTAAAAPHVSRELERRQPWHHAYDDDDVNFVRELLQMPATRKPI